MKTLKTTKLLATALIMCLVSVTALSQTTGQVKVSVSDATGPLIGAAVLVQGTSNGVITDSDGVATLNAPRNSIIEISMIGYATQTISVEGRTSLSVILEEDTVMLDEVVFIGYGTAKKSDLTGSVAKADIETLRHSDMRPTQA